jgi:hypothetical protein
MSTATREAITQFERTDGVTSPIAVSAGEGNTTIVSMIMTRAGFDMLGRLASETNTDLETVIGKAFILYKEAHDASQRGKAVGIAEAGDVLETRFTGL